MMKLRELGRKRCGRVWACPQHLRRAKHLRISDALTSNVREMDTSAMFTDLNGEMCVIQSSAIIDIVCFE